MKAKLDKTKYLKDLYVKMTATVTTQRDVVWQREDQLQLEKLELAHHLDTVNDLAMNIVMLHSTYIISSIHLQAKERWTRTKSWRTMGNPTKASVMRRSPTLVMTTRG